MPKGSVQGATWASSNWYNRTSEYLGSYSSTMKSFSLHKYARSSCHSTRPVTQAELLSYVAAEGSFNREWVAAVSGTQQAKLPFVIGEGNSISCGGTTGVSDTAAAALWVLDFLPWASKHGAEGMQFHGGPHGPYAAISFSGPHPGVPSMHPLYYGLLAFSELVGDYSKWLETSIAPSETPSDGDPLCKGGIQSSQTCCAASCGLCGGGSCGGAPGGAAACCGGTIERANKSCASHTAPCVLDESWGPSLAAHSTIDAEGRVKVLLVAKDLKQTAPRAIAICLNASTAINSKYANQTMNGTLARLLTPNGAATKVGDGMTWAGQTFDNTTDGTALGLRSVSIIASNPRNESTGGQVCFDVSLPPLTAAMLTVAIA